MPYVQRNSEGQVLALYAKSQPDLAEEALPSDHPDVVAFQVTQADRIRERDLARGRPVQPLEE